MKIYMTYFQKKLYVIVKNIVGTLENRSLKHYFISNFL